MNLALKVFLADKWGQGRVFQKIVLYFLILK